MAEPIVSAHIGISADSAEVEKATRRAAQSLRGFERAGEAAGKAIADSFLRMGAVLAGALSVQGLTQFGSRILETATNIRRFSDMAGLTTTQFQELQFALRNTGVSGEQMGAAFARFSANLTDLQRGTGGLLQFLRESAPQFIPLFRNVRDTNEGFTLLTRILAQAENRHTALRLAQAAGGEQMGRFALEAARLGPQLDAARQAAHQAGRVMSEQMVNDLQRAQQTFKDLGDQAVIQGARIINAFQQAAQENRIRVVEIALNDLSARLVRMTRAGQDTAPVIARLNELWAEYAQLAGTASAATQNLGAQVRSIAQAVAQGVAIETWRAQTNAVKEANAALQLYMTRLQGLPPAAIASTTAFQEAWRRTEEVLANQSATASERELARLNLMQQLHSAQMGLMGEALTAEERLAERLRVLSDERVAQLLGEDRVRRAMAQAQMAYTANVISGIGQGLQAMSSAWPKQKAFSAAVALTSGLAGAIRAYQDLPTWAAIPTSAMILAATAKNIATIMSTNPGSTGGVSSAPAVGGGVAPADTGGPSGPSRAFTLQSFDPSSLFTGAEVERLIAAINEEVGNGAVLISTSMRPT